MGQITIKKGNGGLGRREPSSDNIRGLVMNGGANMPSGLAVNTPLECFSPDDAKDVGIDTTYDGTEGVLCYYHIKEFFRMNPNGKLWVYLTAQPTTITQMVDVSSNPACAVLKLNQATNGEIKCFGVARNPDSSYTPTITNGLDGDVLTAIPKAEALANLLFAEHSAAHFILEGRSFAGSATAAANLRGLQSPSVSVAIHQDLDVVPPTSPAPAMMKAHAAIGTLLGTSSAAKVNENVGYVEKFDLSDKATGSFINPGFSNNQPITSLSATDRKVLDSRGFIFVEKYVGSKGVYFNDSHTCTELSSDYAYMEDAMVINKGARGIYINLLPKLKAPILLDKNGYLSNEVVKSYEALGKEALDDMERAEEISANDININRKQNLIVDKLKIIMKVVSTRTNREMEVELGYAVSI